MRGRGIRRFLAQKAPPPPPFEARPQAVWVSVLPLAGCVLDHTTHHRRPSHRAGPSHRATPTTKAQHTATPQAIRPHHTTPTAKPSSRAEPSSHTNNKGAAHRHASSHQATPHHTDGQAIEQGRAIEPHQQQRRSTPPRLKPSGHHTTDGQAIEPPHTAQRKCAEKRIFLFRPPDCKPL